MAGGLQFHLDLGVRPPRPPPPGQPGAASSRQPPPAPGRRRGASIPAPRENTPDVHVGGARGDVTDPAVAAVFENVEGDSSASFLSSTSRSNIKGIRLTAPAGSSPSGRILLEPGPGPLSLRAPTVTSALTWLMRVVTRDHRHLEAFRGRRRPFGHGVGLLRIGRPQDGQVAKRPQNRESPARSGTTTARRRRRWRSPGRR